MCTALDTIWTSLYIDPVAWIYHDLCNIVLYPCTRDETILQYIDIYYSNTIQYGLNEISIYCALQYIVIIILQYIAMFVVLMLIIKPQK